MSTDAVQTVQLEVLPPLSADERDKKRPHAGGRPLFLDARRFIRICHWIEHGESASEACRLELVSYRHFRWRVVRVSSYQRRLKEAEEIRESVLREFHMANIKQHASKNLLASLWWLERRYPAEFALRNVNRPDPEREKKLEEEIPAEALARHRALVLELAREDEARAKLTQGESGG
jgi:hypothetical protein